MMYEDVASAPSDEELAAGKRYGATPDGKIDFYDSQIRIGKRIPGYFYGITLGSNFKSFDFSVLFSGTGNVQQINNIKQDGTSYGWNNQLTTVLDRWTPTNSNSDIPRAIGYGASSTNNNNFS